MTGGSNLFQSPIRYTAWDKRNTKGARDMKIQKISVLLMITILTITLTVFSTAESFSGESLEVDGWQYSWNHMLVTALEEAYRLQAECAGLAGAFPGEGALVEAHNAASEHLQYMLALCASYGVGPEAVEFPVSPEPPESLQNAYQRMFQAEERHARMVQEFLNQEYQPENTGELLTQLHARTLERLKACEEAAKRLGYAFEYQYGENVDYSERSSNENREGVGANDDTNGEGVLNNNTPSQEGDYSGGDENQEGIGTNDDNNGEGVLNNNAPSPEGIGGSGEGIGNNSGNGNGEIGGNGSCSGH
jgi:hypothetical protein